MIALSEINVHEIFLKQPISNTENNEENQNCQKEWKKSMGCIKNKKKNIF